MRRFTIRTAWAWCWLAGLPALLIWSAAADTASAQPADEPVPADADTDGAEPREDVTDDTETDDRSEAEATKTPGAPASPRSNRSEKHDELARAKQLLKSVRAEIDLRDEQAVRINDLFEAHFEALAERIKDRERHRGENAARIHELREELKQAQREEDNEAVRQIRGELRELLGADSGMREYDREFNATVLQELNEEQGDKYRELVRRAMVSDRAGSNKLREIQVINRALRELDLPPRQRRAAMKHLRGLKEILAEARDQGDEAFAKAIDDLREAILGELDDAQIAQFEEAEERMRSLMQQRRRPGGGRPGKAYDRNKLEQDRATTDEEGSAKEPEEEEADDPGDD